MEAVSLSATLSLAASACFSLSAPPGPFATQPSSWARLARSSFSTIFLLYINRPSLVGSPLISLTNVAAPSSSPKRYSPSATPGRRLGGKRTRARGSSSPATCSTFAEVGGREWKALLNKLEQPRLIHGRGNNEILMAGGLRSWDASCSTFVILRLHLDRLEWDEVGRMPKMMFKWFEDSPKLKAFGGGDWVYVSGKSVRRVAMWNSSSSDWRWLHGVDGHRKSVRKGFVFDATLTAVP
ncbi:hypothetical protein AAC387_Pa02g1722 [Persea americana]